ncbi:MULTISPECIES: hypothetical protein [Streptomyces]|uniref:Integral membrane protein n=1 Tax=Streptomyces ehimensis TaxID=68195 RepID=A0ABV9BUZ6_9ACTN
MSLDLQAAANKRMRRGLIALAAIVVVLAVIIVFLLAFGGDKKTTDGKGASAGTQPAPAATETPSDTYTNPKNWVDLPNGTGTSNGLPVKFPKSPEGAAAMMVSLLRASWTLDPADVARAATTYSLPQEVEAVKAAAPQAAAGNRKVAGIPTDGPIPPGARFFAIPIGVQWTRQDDTHVRVSVDIRVVTNAGNGAENETQLISMAGMAVWSGDDWKNASLPPGDQPEPFDIGSEGFNKAGWKAIQEGGRR